MPTLLNIKASQAGGRTPLDLPNHDDVSGTSPLIDLEALEHLTEGDAHALKSLLEPLIDSLEDDMGGLLNAFTKNDLPGLSEIAHKVKSGARMIKATHLAHCCEGLELACLSPEWSHWAHGLTNNTRRWRKYWRSLKCAGCEINTLLT